MNAGIQGHGVGMGQNDGAEVHGAPSSSMYREEHEEQLIGGHDMFPPMMSKQRK
jgi:hypothetical protein